VVGGGLTDLKLRRCDWSIGVGSLDGVHGATVLLQWRYSGEVAWRTFDNSAATWSVPASGPATHPVAPLDFTRATNPSIIEVRMYAEERNWPLEEVEVVVEFHKEIIDRRPVDIFEKRVILHGAYLSGEQRQKLLEISAKAPIQRTLESAPVIRTIL